MPRVVKRPDLGQAAVPLEPTYSPAEVAKHFGCTVRQVHKLIAQGRRKPYRGGLANTFKASPKLRRIPLSSIERHKRHLANPQAVETEAVA